MTDAELIARLRGVWRYKDLHLCPEAADRIEELGKACTEWAEVSQSNYQRAKAAEAKLAKAVEALKNSAIQLDWCQAAREISKEIDATLAEIKSHSDEFATQKGENHD